MLDEGCVHLLASDAHDAQRRPPNLAEGREIVAKRVGAEEAQRLVLTRPMGILKDQTPSSLPGPVGVANVKSVSSLRAEDRLAPSAAFRSGDARDGVRGVAGRLRRLFK
jgi:protein-tyrosine phosphatase